MQRLRRGSDHRLIIPPAENSSEHLMVPEAVRAVRRFRGVRPQHQTAPVAGREREFRLRGGVREETRILQGGREIRVAGHQSVRFRRPGKEQHREVARRLRIRRTGTVEARRGQERPSAKSLGYEVSRIEAPRVRLRIREVSRVESQWRTSGYPPQSTSPRVPRCRPYGLQKRGAPGYPRRFSRLGQVSLTRRPRKSRSRG